MKGKDEGIRRLSILIGTVCSFVWAIFVVISTEGFSMVGGLVDWLIIIGGLVICFWAPYALVRGIRWVVLGFKQDRFNDKEDAK